MRAEIRAGELLAEMAAKGERAVRKNMKSQAATSKLADLGITKSQSSRWQRLAAREDREEAGALVLIFAIRQNTFCLGCSFSCLMRRYAGGNYA
jgi:hypothetical protein